MAIVVEDGSIVSGANSYVAEATLTTFASDRGVTLTADEDELLIKAMDYIEALNFKGIKQTKEQGLQWPRYNVVVDGYYLDNDEIPQSLKDGLCHAAIAIDQGNDPLQDQERKTLSERVSDIEVTYSESSASNTVNKKVLNSLYKLLSNGSGQLTVDKG